MNADEIHGILNELEELEAKNSYNVDDLRHATELEARARGGRDRMLMRRELEKLGTPSHEAVQEPGMNVGGGLYGAIVGAGFDFRAGRKAVVVPAAAALGIESKAGSFSGDLSADGLGVIDITPAPGLGLDSRFLFPRLNIVALPPDATSVASYRQASRSLASTSSMVRDVDDTSTKPETDTASELVTAPVKQIATVSTATPNVLLQNPNFRSWVSNDLELAYRQAVDYHVITEIAAATPSAGSGGTNVYENVLYAQELVASAGYNATLVVVSPADALAIKLLIQEGGDHYAFSVTPPDMVVTPSVDDGQGFVTDPRAAGTLYLSPAAFAVFEENAGATNSSTARFESNGLYVTQRTDAIAMLEGSS
jgi:hypothetical protein